MSEAKEETVTDLQLATLPPCAQQVYSILKDGTFKPTEIEKRMDYSSRSIRSALKMLHRVDLVEKLCDFKDLRIYYYRAK
ncbi:MAG: hypothetical protein ACW981_03105 [Candidatus Hodarchaeales archaeon]|jgi:predicted transcriptional regulator